MKNSCLLLVALLGVAVAEVAKITKCEEYSDDICEVTEVHITPCKVEKSRCVLRKGFESSIEFDFIPKFEAASLTSGLWWASPSGTDVRFDAFSDVDACQYTGCPTTSGQSQRLTLSLMLNKKLPNGIYTFKWKLWDTADKTKTCCFKTDVALRK